MTMAPPAPAPRTTPVEAQHPTVPVRDPVRTIGLMVTAVCVLASVLVVQQLALRDVRALERSYVAGRRATACTIARLAPGAAPPPVDADDVDTRLDDLARSGLAAAEEVRRSQELVDTSPLPPARTAHRRVDDAIDAQVRFYAALAADQSSEEEVRALGGANRRAEHALSGLRRWALVGAGAGWQDRFDCADGASEVSGG